MKISSLKNILDWRSRVEHRNALNALEYGLYTETDPGSIAPIVKWRPKNAYQYYKHVLEHKVGQQGVVPIWGRACRGNGMYDIFLQCRICGLTHFYGETDVSFKN